MLPNDKLANNPSSSEDIIINDQGVKVVGRYCMMQRSLRGICRSTVQLKGALLLYFISQVTRFPVSALIKFQLTRLVMLLVGRDMTLSFNGMPTTFS